MDQGDPASIRRRVGASPALTAACLLGLASLTLPAEAAGLDLFGPSTTGLSTDLWRAGEAVPGAVRALLHAGDGYLWIGTSAGLARFDGVRFTQVPIGTADRPPFIYDLLDDGAGGVWIASSLGLGHWTSGGYMAVDAGGRAAHSLLLTREGTLLVGTDRGLLRLSGGVLVPVGPATAEINALAEEPDGRVLVGTEEGLWRMDHEGIAPVPPLDGGTDRTINVLLPTGEGTWMGFRDGLRLVRPQGRGGPGPAIRGLMATDVLALASDGAGGLWIGTFAGGVQRLAAGRDRVTERVGGLSNQRAEALLQERGGALWVGSHGGLERLRAGPIGLLGPREGLSAEVTWSVYTDPKDGALWVGLDGAGLDRLDGERVTAYSQRWGLEGDTVTAMLRGADGALWLGARNRGLLRVVGDRVEEVRGPGGQRLARVRSLLQAHDGALWIGWSGGLARYRNGQAEPAALKAPLPAWALAEAPDGAIWAAGPRVARLSGPDLAEDTPPAVEAMGDGDGLLVDGEDLWIVSYGRGLFLWHAGTLTSVAALDRRFAGFGVALIPDLEGRFWYARESGLVVMARQALRALAQRGVPLQAAVELDSRDGLVSTGVNISGQNPVAIGRDGRLWFASTGGVTVADPARLRAAAATVPPVVEAALVDGQPRALGAGGLELEGRSTSLELRFTSPSLSAPHRLRFRHRLEGWERDWMDGDPSRAAHYRGLGEGSYRFALQVQRDGGPWIDGAAPLAVTVRLLPLERRAVQVALGLGALGLLAGAGFGVARARERRLRAHAAELRQLVAARTRELAAARDELEVRVQDRSAQLQEELTRRDRLERQLAEVQKLDSIGRLAGGVAHDLNNLLTVVLGCASTAQVSEGVPDDVRLDLSEIEKAGQRAAALTRQLLAFARRQHLEVRRLDLREVMSNVDSLLRRLLGADIQLGLSLPDAPCLVLADSAQLEQVLVNLAVNARDAMPGGGSLQLEARQVRLETDDGGAHPGVPAGDYVRLSVRDSGTGMSAEAQRHLFEPFFTTKEKGKGTGLGLATCYGIVKQLGGHIWAESTPGQGSTFEIHLPRVEGSAEATGVRVQQLTHGGHEQLLLVEDEPQLLALAARTLRDRGYRVLTAGDGQEALDVLSDTKAQIALLVTDVVMPRIGGPELLVRLRQRQPGLRAVFISGYLPGAGSPRGALPAGAPLLPKPFTPDELAARVREELDRPATG
jgi:signal transduction histidine kinase/ligand-binding sensor domain-containing protein/ActR/RegA family two-component response regulator